MSKTEDDFNRLFEKRLMTKSGELISEIQLMLFFTMFAKLKLVKSGTGMSAFDLMVSKLERTN